LIEAVAGTTVVVVRAAVVAELTRLEFTVAANEVDAITITITITIAFAASSTDDEIAVAVSGGSSQIAVAVTDVDVVVAEDLWE
jgi:hypothetical protein